MHGIIKNWQSNNALHYKELTVSACCNVHCDAYTVALVSMFIYQLVQYMQIVFAKYVYYTSNYRKNSNWNHSCYYH